MNHQKNWAGNLIYRAKHWHEPRSVEEIQQLVKEASHVRVVGSRHSFNDIADSDDTILSLGNDIADSDDTILSLGNLNRVLAFDQEKQTVTIEGGMRYGELSSYLEERGFCIT